MPLTQYPNGVSSFGVPVLPGFDMFSGPAYFVCNKTGCVRGDGTSADRPLPSIADALAKLSSDSSQGSRVFVLEGHAENVTASNTFSGTDSGGPNTGAQTIPAGCRIIGFGINRARPTLTLTAAGSTIALASANSGIENFNILCPQTGTTTNAVQVTVTAAGCTVHNVLFQMASSATALATTGIQLSSAATEFESNGCEAYATTGTPTSWLSTTGTAAPARVRISNAYARLPLSATTGGVIDTSAASGTAPVGWDISYSNFSNDTASSTVVLKLVAGFTGQVRWCGLGFKNATGAATTINALGNVEIIETYATTVAKAGLIAGTVSG